MNIVRAWYDIIDSWFGITITIGIIAMIGGAIYSIAKSAFGSDRTPKPPSE